ncbi:MAG: protein arginine kinase [Firmicutes bacterium]|nr:protein arginine kinase [Bacillota bacterium]
MTLKETVNSAHSLWMDDGPESGIVISSRVRVARNLKDIPFPHLLQKEKAEGVIHAVRHALDNPAMVTAAGRLELCRMAELSPVERQILVDKHLISPVLLNDYQDKAVALREDEVVSIMVNEEDHLRIQCLLPGLQLSGAWETVDKVDDGLEKTLDYAFSEHYGYLTACPTNVGTGMRASVMLHLSGLVLTRQLNGVLAAIHKLGLTVRGLYGEGTEALGDLFQISNQITLGQQEEEIIANLTSITRQILAQERAARTALYKEKKEMVEDRVWRSYGIVTHARIISAEEIMKLISDLRLGLDLNILPPVPLRLLNELMVMTRPAFLIKLSGQDLSPYQCDLYRAGLLRDKLKNRDIQA